MHRVATLAISLLAAPALAQEPTVAGEAPAPTVEVPKAKEYRFKGVAPRVRDHRAFAMEFGFRSRIVSVPRSVMDIWFYDIDNPDWAYVEPRPNIIGYALGVEWVLKSNSANGIFWAEFMDSEMDAGYWDDIEEPPDHLDGDFLAPSPGLGLVAFGSDYAYEAHLVRTRDTRGVFGLSFLMGGGLGLGIMTGRLDRWGPDDDGNPSYKRFLDGAPPDENKQLPRVYPIIDVNSGLRFNFGDRVVFRVEGGLHTLVYYGATAGVMF